MVDVAPRHPLRRIVAMLRPHAAGEGATFATGAVLGVVTVVLHVLRPWPLKWIVDGFSGAPVAAPPSIWVSAWATPLRNGSAPMKP